MPEHPEDRPPDSPAAFVRTEAAALDALAADGFGLVGVGEASTDDDDDSGAGWLDSLPIEAVDDPQPARASVSAPMALIAAVRRFAVSERICFLGSSQECARSQSPLMIFRHPL